MFGLSLIKTKDLKLLKENLREKEMHYKNTWDAWKMADAEVLKLRASIIDLIDNHREQLKKLHAEIDRLNLWNNTQALEIEQGTKILQQLATSQEKENTNGR